MLSSICELLSSTVSSWLACSATFSIELVLSFHFAINFAWGHNGMVFVCSIPQPSKYLSMAHCHWLLIMVNHES